MVSTGGFHAPQIVFANGVARSDALNPPTRALEPDPTTPDRSGPTRAPPGGDMPMAS